MGVPFVSVVIPTHNRARKVADCLRSLLALEYPADSYEIIVVDAASSDDTHQRVGSLSAGCEAPTVRYLHRASSDANSARNAGLAAATGELMALIDDDVLVPSDWMSALANGASRWRDAECFGGPVRPLYESPPPRTCGAHQIFDALDEGRSSKEVGAVWGGNMAIRRGALERAGPFREGLPVLQEWEWEQRLLASGGHLVYLSEAWLWHRRDRADVAVGPLLRDRFMRGYVEGVLGPPVALRRPVRIAAVSFCHAILARCTRGLTDCARQLGLLCGALSRLRRG